MDNNKQLHNKKILSEYGFNKNITKKKQRVKHTINKSSKSYENFFTNVLQLDLKQLNTINGNKKQDIKIRVNKKPNLNIINKSNNLIKNDKKMCKIRIIQTWWKKISKIIKLQKNIRCFLSKRKFQVSKNINLLSNIINSINTKQVFNFLKNNKQKCKISQKSAKNPIKFQKFSTKKIFINKIYINQIASSTLKNFNNNRKAISYRKPKDIFRIKEINTSSKIVSLKNYNNLKKNNCNKINLKSKMHSNSHKNLLKSLTTQNIKINPLTILESKKKTNDKKRLKKEESITVINNINNIYNNNILGYCPYWNDNNNITSPQTQNYNNFSYICDNENIINSYFNSTCDNKYFNFSNNISNNIPNNFSNTYRNTGEIPSLLTPYHEIYNNSIYDNNSIAKKIINHEEYFYKWKKLSVVKIIIKKLRCLYLLKKFLKKKYMKIFLSIMKRRSMIYDSKLSNKEYNLLNKIVTFNGKSSNKKNVNSNKNKKETSNLNNINNVRKNLQNLINYKNISFKSSKFNKTELKKNIKTYNNLEFNNQSQEVFNKLKNSNYYAYKNLKQNMANSKLSLLTDRSVRSINNMRKSNSNYNFLTDRNIYEKNYNKKQKNQKKFNTALKKNKISNNINNKTKDLVAQINQLTMIFNILDQISRKNKIKIYFKEWKKISNKKLNSYMIRKNTAIPSLLKNKNKIYTKPHNDSVRANSINSKNSINYQTLPVSLKSIYYKKILPQSFANNSKNILNLVNKNNVLSMDFCDILKEENCANFLNSPEGKYGLKKLKKIEEKEIKFNIKKK